MATLNELLGAELRQDGESLAAVEGSPPAQELQGSLADLVATAPPSAPTPVPVQAKSEEPGYIETGLTGVVRGGYGLLSGAGAATEWAGDITGVQGLRTTGREMQEYAKKVIASPVGQLEGPSFEGTFMENPSFKKAVGIVGEAVPSLVAAYLTGGASAAGLRGAGVAASTALKAGTGVAAGGLGLLEGAPQYIEAKQEGKSVGEASAIGAASTLGTAALEYLGLGKLFGQVGKGVIKGAATGVVSEGMQEGAQQLWQNIVAKVGYDKSRSLVEGMAEAVIGGAGAGGMAGALAGGTAPQKDRILEQTLSQVIPGAEVSVSGGNATVTHRAGETTHTIKAPASVIAESIAAGVSIEELAAATSEIERGVSAVKAQQIPERKFARLEDSPATPEAVRYNIRGKEYSYVAPEGESRQNLEAGIAGKTDAAAVNWLRKNAILLREAPGAKVSPPATTEQGVAENIQGEVKIPEPSKLAEAVGKPGEIKTLTDLGVTEPVAQTEQIVIDAVKQKVDLAVMARTKGKTALADKLEGQARENGEKLMSADGPITEQFVTQALNGLPKQDRIAGKETPFAPQGVAPQGVAPQGVAPQGVAPQGVAPQGVAPQGVAPQGVAPQGVAPQGVAPQGVAPEQVAAAAARVDPSILYNGFQEDGKGGGIHLFTAQTGVSKGGTFAVQGAPTTKNIRAALAASKQKFAAPATSAKQTAFEATTAKRYAPLAKQLETAMREDSAQSLFKRVPSLEAAIAFTKQKQAENPKAKLDMAAIAELAEMGEQEYQKITALPEEITSENIAFAGNNVALEAATVQAGIEGKTIMDAAKFLIDHAPSPAYRLIATKVRATLQRLAAQGMSFELHIAHVGGQVPSNLTIARGLSRTFLAESPRVEVWLNGTDVIGKEGVSYEVALHELIHAATQAALHLGNLGFAKGTTTAKTVRELYDVTNEIIAHFNTRIEANAKNMGNLTTFERTVYEGRTNALANPHEVLAWALSNEAMQEYLETIKLKDQQSLWSKFVSAVRILLGLPATSGTALSKVLQTSEEIFDAPVFELLAAAKTKIPATAAQTTAFQVSNENVSAGPEKTLRGSRETLGAILGALSNPKAKMHDIAMRSAPQWLAVTPLHTLVQTFGKRVPQLGRFAKHIDGVVYTKNEIIDTASSNHDNVLTALRRAKIDISVFNAAAATASFNRMSPWEDIYTQGWVPRTGTNEQRLAAAQQKWTKTGLQKATGKSYSEAFNEAQAAYRALQTDELKKAYIAVVGHLSDIRTRERNNLLAFIEQVSTPGSEDRALLMARFDASFANLYGAYWPLARFGNYRMEYMDSQGARVVEYFDTPAERTAYQQQLIDAGVDPQSIKADVRSTQAAASAAIPQQLLDQLNRIVQKKYTAQIDPANTEAMQGALADAQETINDMAQIWLRWQPETSALKNSLRRGNVKGFSTDMLRSYLDYTQRHAASIAWTEQGRQVEREILSLEDTIKEQQQDDTRADTTMQRHLANDLRARVQALKTAKTGKAASFLGKLGTAYYMTSPSIALVQMSQLGVLTFPKLAVTYGTARATKALTKGVSAAFSKKYSRAAMFADDDVNLVHDNFRAVVTAENRTLPVAKGKALGERLFSDAQLLIQVARLTPYQQQLLVLREAMARNLLDISAAHEAYDIAKGGDPRRLRNRIFNLAMQPMKQSELASRKATILATLELTEGTEFFAQMDEIAAAVNDTLHNYSREYKGAALQGGASRVLLQFQHFRIMTGLRLGLLLHDSLRGETAETKKAALKEFTGIMGVTGMLAGTLGVPFASTIFAILGALFGGDDEPFDPQLEYTNWLRENFGETAGGAIAGGLPTLAGVNLTRRLGLGDLFGVQNSPPDTLHGRELAAWWAANLLGPSFSVAQGWLQGYDEIINKGHYMRGLEAATPKPIRDALKAIRISAEGVKTNAGKKIVSDEKIGPDEIFALALGFNPEEIAKAQQAEHSLRGISTKISERRGKLIRDAATAIAEREDATETLDSIRAFNTKMPLYAITGADITPAVRKLLKGELGTTSERERLTAEKFAIPVYGQ